MAFSFVNNALLRTGTLTLCKVTNVLEPVPVGVHLMLACKCLFELHLLLHLDLLVGQNRVFAGGAVAT